MNPLIDPGLEPLFWDDARSPSPSAWRGHVPFAHWLVAATQPRLIVELGTHAGVSYSAFCQAVALAALPTRCFAVDTWHGDDHTGVYATEVFTELNSFNAARFGGFSTLLRMKFDDAVGRFADGSIDLLHIDGFHTYEAVRHDFETWRPKLSARAVVLFHDIAVRERDFGVWRLWDELAPAHPHFAFDHAFGLGVLAAGSQPPDAVAQLCAATPDDAARLGRRFATLGARMERASDTSRGLVPHDEPAHAPPPSDATIDVGDIFIAERFIGPAYLASLTLPRDALTRGAEGCAVWIATLDGADWRQATLHVQPRGAPVLLGFREFDTAGPRHFHLMVTGPCAAGADLPEQLVPVLASRRPPIALGSPDLPRAVPHEPRRGVFLVQDDAFAPDNREAPTLPVTCDYARVWRDQFGAYLSGWTHCDTDLVRQVALVLGGREVVLDLEPRPDVVPHYPQCGATIPVGWRGYVPGPPGLPLHLRVTTDTASRLITPELPERLTRMPTPDPLVSPLQERFVGLVNAERLRVLEIGGRVVGPEAIDWRTRMSGATAYVGLDIHPSPSVDIVGDAHHLTRYVAPGSQDAIWSADVIEHLRMPWLAAAEINRALRPGGYAFIIAPHTWPVHEAPADYWRFSDEGLKILFGPAFGFEVIEAVLAEPMAIHPLRRSFPSCEMPLHPGYGHAIILSRKVAELPAVAGIEAHCRDQVGDSGNYPDTDRMAREAARAQGPRSGPGAA